MRRALEIVFQHPLRLVVLLVLLPAVGFGIAYKLPRTYQSQADLWALQRYVVIGATGAETNLQATPADTQAAALSELLQSRAFALIIAHATKLPAQMRVSVGGNSQTLDDALCTEISKNVQVTSHGSNLYAITYANTDPVIAKQVVQAVIQTFAAQSSSFSAVEGQRLLEVYQAQLSSAQQDANAKATAEARYIADHPSLMPGALATDPQYVLLHSQTQQAQALTATIQTNIANLDQELGQASSSNNLFEVLDPPTVPVRPVSRVRTVAIGIGGGLAVGLLACAVYLALLVRRNRAIYSPLELRRVTSVPVILELPVLSSNSAALSVQLLHSGEVSKGRGWRQ